MVVAGVSVERLLADVAAAEPARVLALASPGAAEGAVLALAAAKSGAAGPHAAGVLLTGAAADSRPLGPHACKVLRARPGPHATWHCCSSTTILNFSSISSACLQHVCLSDVYFLHHL